MNIETYINKRRDEIKEVSNCEYAFFNGNSQPQSCSLQEANIKNVVAIRYKSAFWADEYIFQPLKDGQIGNYKILANNIYIAEKCYERGCKTDYFRGWSIEEFEP